MIEKRRHAQRLYYLRKQEINETDEEAKILDKAKKQMISYEKQKERQRQRRAERGLNSKGRPFKTTEDKSKADNLIKQLNDIKAT